MKYLLATVNGCCRSLSQRHLSIFRPCLNIRRQPQITPGFKLDRDSDKVDPTLMMVFQNQFRILVYGVHAFMIMGLPFYVRSIYRNFGGANDLSEPVNTLGIFEVTPEASKGMLVYLGLHFIVFTAVVACSPIRMYRDQKSYDVTMVMSSLIPFKPRQIVVAPNSVQPITSFLYRCQPKGTKLTKWLIFFPKHFRTASDFNKLVTD